MMPIFWLVVSVYDFTPAISLSEAYAKYWPIFFEQILCTAPTYQQTDRDKYMRFKRLVFTADIAGER